MSVIDGLLNTESQSFKQSKIIHVDLDEINTNPLNTAPMINIEELASIINEQGLQTPLQVYKKENHCYMLINGERRYRALMQLGIQAVPVVVVDKPTDTLTERMMIMDANVQRDETKEYKQQRAKEYEELYHELKKQGSIQTGLLKIEWIAQHMNVSSRQVQRYLSKPSEKKETKPSENPYEDLEEEIQNKLKTKVSIRQHTMKLAFDDTEDLNRILELLHIEI